MSKSAQRTDLLALFYYLPVILLLTLLKGFFVIGHLWLKDTHLVREVQLIPFNDFAGSATWFGPLFNVAGNAVLFVPFGILTYLLLRSVRKSVLLGFVFSLAIELVQFAFALGITDTDDLILNTLGALFGAALVKATGARMEKVWRWACLLFATFIYVLYLLGPRLGSEEKMTPVSQPVADSAVSVVANSQPAGR
ncbi:VanZ family protein [Corynebacterium sp. H128]|uniref:VanZ family protein n=1 Tax=unclassified Corynebacterium TaxID=2624378 RepID=UPI0030A24056